MQERIYRIGSKIENGFKQRARRLTSAEPATSNVEEAGSFYVAVTLSK